MTRQSTRIKRERIDPVAKVAREIDLASAHHTDFGLAEKAQYNSDKTRDTIVGSSKTVRRLTRIERLVKLGIIDRAQATACEWYADQHCLGYDTVGCTANYGGAGGGGSGKCDFVRSKAQYHARENFLFARDGIPAELVPLFDSVVLGTLGENDFRTVTANEVFRIGIAAWRLHGQVGHLIAIAA